MTKYKGFSLYNCIVVLLCLAMLLLMTFNLLTTQEILVYLLGSVGLVNIVSLAMTLVDAAGIALVTTVDTKDPRKTIEDTFFYMMLIAWLLAAIADIALTWVWGMYKLEASPAMASGKITTTMLQIVPAAIALCEFGIRVPLVIGIGRTIAAHQNKPSFDSTQLPRPLPTSVRPAATFRTPQVTPYGRDNSQRQP